MLYIIGRESSTDTVVVMEQYQETDFVTPPAVLPDMQKLAEFWGPRGEEFARLVFNQVGIKTDGLPAISATAELTGPDEDGACEEVPPTLAGWPPQAEATEATE